MSRVRDLPEITSLANEDMFYVVDFSAGPNGGRKIVTSNLKAAVALSAAEIKTLYESNPDTNAFTDADKALVATVSGKVNRSGDTMAGILDMGGNRITSVGDPVSAGDALNKAFVAPAPVVLNVNTTLNKSQKIVLVNSPSPTTITLPDLTTMDGESVMIKNIGDGPLTVAGQLSQLIDGAATAALNYKYSAVTFVSANGGWNVW